MYHSVGVKVGHIVLYHSVGMEIGHRVCTTQWMSWPSVELTNQVSMLTPSSTPIRGR